MTASSTALDGVGPPAPTRVARLRTHLSDPFSRNSYALMVNTGTTGLLGLAYWFLAARYYDPADVGRGSALVSAMTLLAAVVGINITGTLSRFLPRSGRGTARLVLTSYGLSSLVVALLATGFVLTLGWWGPSFTLLRSPMAAVCFVGVAVAANVFTVQDGVLVGLRGAPWVAAENTAFGVAKIVLLIGFAAALPTTGLYLSWIVPMTLLCLPVNALLFGRAIPRHARETAAASVPATGREVRRFAAGDITGALFGFGAIYLVPVVVAAALAPETFAVFYIAWMMAAVLNLVGNNLAQSLTVEGVFDAGRLAGYARSALSRSVVILGVAAVVVLVAAPVGLRLLGPGYDAAAPLLQMLALAAVARAVVEVWLGVLRALGRARAIVRWQVVSGTAVVGAVTLGLHLGGGGLGLGLTPVTGVGVLVLGSQTAVALAVLPRLLRVLAPSGGGPGTSWARRVAAPASDAPNSDAPNSDAPNPDEPSGDGPAPGRPSAWVRATHPAALIGAASVLALVAFAAPLPRVRLDGMNGYGLVSVLPVVSLVGLGLLLTTFVAGLALARPHRLLLGAQLVTITCCLHGVATVLEPLPRFPTAYVHLGFVDYISTYGTTAPSLDGRFSWPGFFALSSFASGGLGWQGLMPLVRLTPLLSNLLHLLVLAMILQTVRASWRARWCAALLFTVLLWIGQDYFSPQGYTFLLYLIFLAVLLRWFRPATGEVVPTPWRDGLRRAARRATPVRVRLLGGRVRSVAATRAGRVLGAPTEPGELPGPAVAPAVRVALLGFLVAVFLAVTVSHQLTPFVLVMVVGALVLTRRVVVRGLPVLLAVLVVAWISYLTTPFWTGHLGDIVGGVGDVSGNVGTSVGARAGGAVQHAAVVWVRVALTAVVFLVAGAGLWRRRRRGIDDRVALLLLGVPFLAVLVQDYGGEIGLRVYMFALPAACLLIAFALFPETGEPPAPDPGPAPVADDAGPGWRHVAAAVAVLVLAGAFLVAAYGNEAFERTRPDELAAARFVDERPGNAQVLFVTDTLDSGATPMMPLGYTDPVGVGARAIPAPRDPADVAPVVDRLRDLGGSTYFMTTRGQEQYLEMSAGYDEGWGQRFRGALAASPDLEKVLDRADAQVYLLRSPDSLDPVRRDPELLGTRIGDTPWSLAGAVVLALLVVALAGREAWTLGHPGRARAARPLAVLAQVGLLVAFGAVIVERLLVLT